MGVTMAFPQPSRQVRSIDSVGPVGRPPLKAGLLSPMESDASRRVDEVCQLVWDALVDGHGSVKAFGLALDDVDTSQLRRQVTRGTLTLEQLAKSDESGLAELGARLLERFGGARKTPQQKAVDAVSEASVRLHQAMQLLLSLEAK